MVNLGGFMPPAAGCEREASPPATTTATAAVAATPSLSSSPPTSPTNGIAEETAGTVAEDAGGMDDTLDKRGRSVVFESTIGENEGELYTSMRSTAFM